MRVSGGVGHSGVACGCGAEHGAEWLTKGERGVGRREQNPGSCHPGPPGARQCIPRSRLVCKLRWRPCGNRLSRTAVTCKVNYPMNGFPWCRSPAAILRGSTIARVSERIFPICSVGGQRVRSHIKKRRDVLGFCRRHRDTLVACDERSARSSCCGRRGVCWRCRHKSNSRYDVVFLFCLGGLSNLALRTPEGDHFISALPDRRRTEFAMV